MSTTQVPATRQRGLLRVLLIQPLWAIPFALFFGTLWGGSKPGGYLLAYQLSLVFAYAIGLALWFTEHHVIPRILPRDHDSLVSSNWSIGLAYGATCLLASYLAATIIHFTLMPGFLGSPRSALISGMFTLLFFGLFSGINFARAFHAQAVERGRAVEQMRAELAEAELRALRAQINPHFLFNTLNSIASLIRVDPEAAEDTTTRLADIFRYVLRASESGTAQLSDELEFLRAYLEIERTRFGERLRIEERIEPGIGAIEIPGLLLQPLVENAVRYAVAPRPEGGRITLSASRAGDLLTLEVADDGPGMSGGEAPSGSGFGLRSVRERLLTAGPPHAFEIDTAPGRGTTIRITIPATAPSAAVRSPKSLHPSTSGDHS